MKKISLQLLLFLATLPPALSQTVPPYKQANLPIEERVKDLLQRMTPEEKFWQLFMIPGHLGNDPSKYKNGIFGFIRPCWSFKKISRRTPRLVFFTNRTAVGPLYQYLCSTYYQPR